MITAKQAIDYYKTVGIRIMLRGSRLRVAGPVTHGQRTLIAGHAKEFKSALRGRDVPLRADDRRHSLATLGLVQIETNRSISRDGVESISYGVTHPDGDETAELILAGVVDFDAAVRDAKDRTDQAIDMHHAFSNPPTGRIHGRPNRF